MNSRERDKWIGVAALLCLFLGMMVMMRMSASKVAELSNGVKVLDLRFAMSPSAVRETITSYNSASVAFYRWMFLTVDAVYIMAYCTFYRHMLRFLRCEWIEGHKIPEYAPLLPLVGAFADLCENMAVFSMLGGVVDPGISSFFCFCNTVKFLFVYLSFFIVIGGTVCLVKERLS